MKEFSEKSRCPKCGCREVGVEWRDPAMKSHQKMLVGLVRECSRCGYRWEEKALDEKKRVVG